MKNIVHEIEVYRYFDAIALNLGGDNPHTIYLNCDIARQLMDVLSEGVHDIESRGFGESFFEPQTLKD